MSNSLLQAFLFFSVAAHAPVQMPYPRVVVRAAIITPRVYEKFKSDSDRQKFLKEIEKVVANAASKLRCLDWQAGVPSSGPQPRAELWAELVDNNSLRRPQVVLSYAGNYGSLLPDRVDPKMLKKTLSPLPDSYNRPVMDAGGYAGDLEMLKDNIKQAVMTQFGEERFEEQFNSSFVANIIIADRLEFDNEEEAVIVPIAAGEMHLESASLRVDLQQAPLCRKDHKDYCRISLTSEGVPDDTKWPGALRCKLDNCCACCKMSASWGQVENGVTFAQERSVFLREHKHCTVCWGPKKLYRNPEAP